MIGYKELTKKLELRVNNLLEFVANVKRELEITCSNTLFIRIIV
jgi:hypothetical protein